MRLFTTILRVLLPALVLTLGARAQSPRMVLIEESTNASCGPCADQNPFFEHYLALSHNKEYIIPVVYHANFPGRDVMNAANAVMHNGRTSYYQISGVPHAVVNGVTAPSSGSSYAGAPGDTIALSRAAAKFLGTTSPITLEVSQARGSVESRSATAIVNVSSTEAIAGKIVHMVVVERHHYYESAGTNGEKDFHYIARVMLPSHQGTALDLNAGGNASFVQDFILDPEWDDDEIYIVAFVQDPVSKEVLQAGSSQSRIKMNSTAATVMQQTDEPAVWPSSLVASNTGEYTVSIEKDLPDGWSGVVSIGGVDVSNGGRVTMQGLAPADLNVRMLPAPTKQGKGTLTMSITGNYGAEWTQSFTCYASGLQALVITKDEGNPRIAEYYRLAMEQGDVRYAIVNRGDEHLFDLTRYVTVIEAGKTGFGAAEIADLKAMFGNGGMRVLLTGAEIAYCLADTGSRNALVPRDEEFLRGYLHADYVADDNANGTLRGIDGDPIGDGLKFSITTGIPNQDTPDQIAPRDGAVPIFYYGTETGDVAGIRYENSQTRLIYLGFGLEGVGSVQQRGEILRRGINWLMGAMSALPLPVSSATALLEARPNPAGSNMVLPFIVEHPMYVSIMLYDMQGRKIATLASAQYESGSHAVQLDISMLPAGTYMAVMEADGLRSARPITVAR